MVGDGGFDELGEVTLPVVEGDAVLRMLDAEDGGEEDVEGAGYLLPYLYKRRKC